MVLDCLLQICNNAQILVDIFVNYDCSLESQDIFGRYCYIALNAHLLLHLPDS